MKNYTTDVTYVFDEDTVNGFPQHLEAHLDTAAISLLAQESRNLSIPGWRMARRSSEGCCGWPNRDAVDDIVAGRCRVLEGRHLGGGRKVLGLVVFFFVKQRDQLANGQDDRELAMAALQQNCWGCSDSWDRHGFHGFKWFKPNFFLDHSSFGKPCCEWQLFDEKKPCSGSVLVFFGVFSAHLWGEVFPFLSFNLKVDKELVLHVVKEKGSLLKWLGSLENG